MSKILGILILILSILLFPPSVLALISNNAVPGDVTYPVKIKLEEGIVLLASFNSNTKIWFSSTRSDRRFQEANILLNRGEAAAQTLNELVIQTDISAVEITQITDQSQKQEFIANLQKSIQKYDDGLAAVQERQSVQTAPSVTPIPTLMPTSAPVPTTSTPTVQPTPKITSVPTEVKNNKANNKEEIKKAREKLEEIKSKLKKAQEDNSIQNIPTSSQQPASKDRSTDNYSSKK